MKMGKSMKIRLLFLSVYLWSSLALAARALPVDMDMAILKQVQYPQVVLGTGGISWLKILTLGWLSNDAVFQVSVDVRIRNEQNRFITRGKLNAYVGKAVGIRRNPANNIEEIWILTDQERATFQARVVQ